MKVKSIRIEQFRGFRDETISLNKYCCFVGPNGAGKSSVLAALNVFFRAQTPGGADVARLTDEDFFCRETANPIRITVTFDDLNPTALTVLSDYVHGGELAIAAEAAFDPSTGFGAVKHFGQRRGMAEFRQYFESEKAGAKADALSAIYEGIRQQFTDLPNARTKEEKTSALRSYEATHPESCVPIPAEDNFCGANNSGKLGSFVQWVCVPAVKYADEEAQESKNSALGQLVGRAVRTRTNFDSELDALKTKTRAKYLKILKDNRGALKDVSLALQRRLGDWAHPDVRLGMDWLSDPGKSVVLLPPVAGIKTGEGKFLGSLARMGHGLQRSYLLALLQELAASDAPDAPTLILGCEEPELYQHPPQARHLAEVFTELAGGNNQIIITTHSPLFVSGDGFEDVRLVRRSVSDAGATVHSLTFENLCTKIRMVTGDDPSRRVDGLVAKIHQALQPGMSEMFFARVPILVEGLEDVSYLTTQLHLSGLWSEFRRLGCHIVPVNGKDKLIQPLAIAKELKLPVFVVFDSDGDNHNADQRPRHERDNRALMALLGHNGDPFPTANCWGADYAIWGTNLTNTVKADFRERDYVRITEAARQHYAFEKGLNKNDLFIAEWISAAYGEELKSRTLQRLCRVILKFARGENAP